jgi:hypothetical protein
MDTFNINSDEGILRDRSELTWINLSESGSQAPMFVTAVEGGEVYLYTYGTISYYRFIPEPYNPSLDQFFSEFSNPYLSGLIATKSN